MASSDSRTWELTKSFAASAIFTLTASQAAASILFVPSLLRPLQQQQQPQQLQQSRISDTTTSSKPLPSSRPSSSLNVPQPTDSGRLTPQPTNEPPLFPTSSPAAATAEPTHKTIAKQFASYTHLSSTRLHLPLYLLSIPTFSLSAYHAHRGNRVLYTHWLASALLLAATLPYTSTFLTPLVTKIRRIAGEEEKVEPYEDAPIEREAEERNLVGFVREWARWNLGRVAVLGVVSVWSSVALYGEYGGEYVLMV